MKHRAADHLQTKNVVIFSLFQGIKQKHVRLEVFMAVTMKNFIFWDIKTQFIPHRRHITSPLQSSAS
jgi:hypothetical protein